MFAAGAIIGGVAGVAGTMLYKREKTGFSEPPVLGYHKIRGLAAPCRMMFFFKKQPFKNFASGDDAKKTWFGERKPSLMKDNSCINLPYVQDGDNVVTQSNTCLLYLGKKLGIDKEEHFIYNHCVLDQTMDLRNSLVKICYGQPDFKKASADHMKGAATTNLKNLEGFMKGPYMCGDVIQSGDFHVFEMLDQHRIICESQGHDPILEQFPKLKNLHAKMRADPALKAYFEHALYTDYAHNNPLHGGFSGQPTTGWDFGPTTEELITF